MMADQENGILRAQPSVEVTFDPETRAVNVNLHFTPNNWNFAKMLLKEAVIVAERMEMAVMQQAAMQQQEAMMMRQRIGM